MSGPRPSTAQIGGQFVQRSYRPHRRSFAGSVFYFGQRRLHSSCAGAARPARLALIGWSGASRPRAEPEDTATSSRSPPAIVVPSNHRRWFAPERQQQSRVLLPCQPQQRTRHGLPSMPRYNCLRSPKRHRTRAISNLRALGIPQLTRLGTSRKKLVADEMSL